MILTHTCDTPLGRLSARCGKPAIEFVDWTGDDGKACRMWYCAEHWDERQSERQRILEKRG